MERKFYIEELSESNWNLWDKWLSNIPYSTPFSTSWWLTAVCDVFGGSPYIIVIKNDKNEYIGGIGIRVVKYFNISIVTLSPLSLYMPIVFSNNLDWRLVLEIEKELASYLKEKFHIIRGIVNTKELSDIRGFQWFGYEVKVLYTAITDLEIFDINILDRSQKKQINKALRTNMIFQISDDIELMWELWNKTFRRQNLMAPISLRNLQYLYRKIRENNGGQGFISFTKDGKPTSFRINMWSNSVTIYDWIAGSDPDYFRDGVSSFTIWSVMNYFREKGFKIFDWCGANIESIANFKLSFGAKLTAIFELHNVPLWFDVANFIRRSATKIIFQRRKQNDVNY